ncbi:MFS transporter [Cryobacterium tepidiphilum]|uniref:MFS transporter n=1 Tax=Cryobacterium tepidiphilum TaxID=2486026 RepID=A0A3M8LQ84_9MICO|nr:MFS transporter [Cryobacterium tepidiphilum]RNE67032.1 MFS transporter [Cryobacterium tepidiphilum]
MSPGGRRAITLVLGHAVLIQAITFAMRPTLSYAVLATGGEAALLGVVSAAFAVPALILALPVGHATDRIGERTSMVIGGGCLVVAALLAAFARGSLVALFAATVLLGIGHLFSVVGEQSIMASSTGRGSFDSRFGLYTFAGSLGQTLGPLLLALPGGTAATPPLDLIFFACAVIAAVILVVSVMVRSSERLAGGARPGMLATARGLLRTRGLPRALLASSIVLASVDLFIAYLPALGHERAMAAAVVSAMLVARSMFSMFSRLFLGRMVRLLGRKVLMVWTIAASAVALGALALPLPVAWLLVLSAVYGFAIGTCQPITMSWISELAPPGTRGLAMSLRLASNRLGQTALPAALGVFASATGAAGVLVASAVVLVGAAWSSAAVGNSEGVSGAAE